MGAKILLARGTRFGRLVVLAEAGLNRRNRVLIRCKCDCGIEKTIPSADLRSGAIVSCGCYLRERVKTASRKHGCARTPIYFVWTNMLARCHNPKNTAYQRYGGKGVTVCDRWRHSFENFLADMGERPKGMTLDRIDNSRGYEPGNCRWTDLVTQSRNRKIVRRISLGERTLTIPEWAAIGGISPGLIRTRIAAGWSPQKAITRPVDIRFGRRPNPSLAIAERIEARGERIQS